MRRRLLAGGLALGLCALLAAEGICQQVATDPTSTHIFPAGGRRGSSVNVCVGGECLPPGVRLRFWGEGISAPAVLGDHVEGNFAPSPRRKPGELHVSYPKQWRSHVEIAADAPLGIRLWRLSCGRGGTGARPFVVGDLPEFIETEPNSSSQEAEAVELPVTVNGQIAGERDLDYFRFAVQAGDVVRAEVAAARLGSPMDPLVEFFDPAGRKMAGDEIRVGADPAIVFRAPSTGEYRALVSNINSRGGPDHVYRLTLAVGPYVRFAFPAVAKVGSASELEFFALAGDGAGRLLRRTVTFPSQAGDFSLRDVEPGANPVALRASDAPTAIEVEGNDTRETATEIAWPVEASGRFQAPADEDWFRLACRQNVLLNIECVAAPLGSPALPVLSVVDAGGGELAQASAVKSDRGVAWLEWRPPADGNYWLRLRDLRQGVGGAPDFLYQLSVREARSGFLLTAKVDCINVLQGGRGELDVMIERRGGFADPIELAVEGLPAGVRVEGHQVAAGQVAARLAFVADADALAGDVTLRILGRAEIDGAKVERALLATHLGHDADGVGLGPTTVDHLQLTVVHQPAFTLFCNEAYQYAHRGTIYPYLMEVERLNGFDGPIHLQVADRQNKDLDGIEVIETTIPPGQSQVMLPLYLPETMHINVQAHSNVYAQGYVDFVDRAGARQTLLVVSTMRCMVRTLPTVVKLRSLDREIVARPGQDAIVHLQLDRTTNFDGPMRIEMIEPAAGSGVSAEAITIPAGETEGQMVVRFGAGPVPRSCVAAKFRAVGAMDGGAQAISEATTPIEIGE